MPYKSQIIEVADKVSSKYLKLMEGEEERPQPDGQPALQVPIFAVLLFTEFKDEKGIMRESGCEICRSYDKAEATAVFNAAKMVINHACRTAISTFKLVEGHRASSELVGLDGVTPLSVMGNLLERPSLLDKIRRRRKGEGR